MSGWWSVSEGRSAVINPVVSMTGALVPRAPAIHHRANHLKTVCDAKQESVISALATPLVQSDWRSVTNCCIIDDNTTSLSVLFL